MVLKRNIYFVFIVVISAVLLGPGLCYAGSQARTGSISGRVSDKYTHAALPGVLVNASGTKRQTITNEKGEFIFKEIPVGSYTLVFEFPEIHPVSKPDVLVRVNRITFVELELDINPVISNEVIVNRGYFPEAKENPGSTTSFAAEEIRRTAGSAGDVTRIVMGLPSIAKVNDIHNSLVVRGGSPAENSFLIDNIKIPNINHFPLMGTSTGPISLLNTDFIKDVNFYSGGFSSLYGDKISSVMEISFREGNREEMDLQFDLNMAGVGAQLEGPVGNKGSWLFSARRSYVDLLVDLMGDSIAPTYSDFQGKVVYDLSERSKLTFLGILGIDDSSFSQEDSREDGNVNFGDSRSREGTFGVNWFWVWSDKGYSDTSLSYMFTRFKNNYFDTISTDMELKSRSTEAFINFRNVNHYNFSHFHKLDFGLEVTRLNTKYDYHRAGYVDVMGNWVAESKENLNSSSSKAGLFVNYMVSPFPKLSINMGVRADYFSLTEAVNVSPRLSVNWKLSQKTDIYSATGIYYQDLPQFLLVSNTAARKFNALKSFHYVLGASHLLTAGTRLKIEAYAKEYRNFPMDPQMPQLFMVDTGLDYGDMYNINDNLLDEGQARSYGIEFTLQKKLKNKLYGMISGSLSRTRYRDLEGTWRSRRFDNRFIFGIEGGYKPNSKWEFSMKWIYAGGLPYTPLDAGASALAAADVYDVSRINDERLPAYQSLNIRADRRFYFKGSTLIVYLSLWNVTNRKNLAGYYWNTIENKIDETKQFGFLPVLGIEYEL